MRVLMFGWEFPPWNSGGLGVACAGLSRALSAKGIEVTFVLPRKFPISLSYMRILFAPDPKEPSDFIVSPYTSQEEYERAYGDLPESVRRLYSSSLFDEVKRYSRFGKFLGRREVFDVIHAHDWLSFGAGIAAKAASGKPLVAHVHATEFDRTGGLSINEYVYRLEKEGMEKADLVIAVSHLTKNSIVAHYGIPPEKVCVVHNGVQEVSSFRAVSELIERKKKEGYKIVSFVGRLTLQKGPDYFLHVAKKVLRSYKKPALFLMAGSGDMERQLLFQAAREGFSDKIIFTGFLRDEELAGIYALSDLFVMPSVSEPFGIAPLEALLSGTPVLISKQSGVSEVLRHAVRVDFWDVDEMANKIIAILEHEVLARHLAVGGKQEAERLTWEDAAQKCIAIYNDVVSHQR